MDFARPTQIEDALSLLAAGDWHLLSGGTDFFPAIAEDMPRGPVMDLSGLEGLRGVTEGADWWSIGALTTWSDVIAADLPPAFDALKLAGREVGSPQIQNRATICGNLCNASPAADGVPPLLCLDAKVVLRSASGSRQMPLASFLKGNRRTALARGELMAELRIPKVAGRGRSTFLKLGARRYLVISISMVAVRLELTADQRVAAAAVSVGACSAVAQRLGGLEADLMGHEVSGGLGRVVTRAHLAGLAPIDDVRASAAYRISATETLLRRALDSLGGG